MTEKPIELEMKAKIDLDAPYNKKYRHINPEKPFKDKNLPFELEMLIWACLRNKNQIFQKNKFSSKSLSNLEDVDSVIATIPQKHFKAMKNFLKKHPITPLSHLYKGKDLEEVNLRVMNTSLSGVFQYSGGFYAIEQVLNQNSEVYGWRIFWNKLSLQIVFWENGRSYLSLDTMMNNQIKLQDTRGRKLIHGYKIEDNGNLGEAMDPKGFY